MNIVRKSSFMQTVRSFAFSQFTSLTHHLKVGNNNARIIGISNSLQVLLNFYYKSWAFLRPSRNKDYIIQCCFIYAQDFIPVQQQYSMSYCHSDSLQWGTQCGPSAVGPGTYNTRSRGQRGSTMVAYYGPRIKIILHKVIKFAIQYISRFFLWIESKYSITIYSLCSRCQF